MAGVSYILDTNAIADYINGVEAVVNRLNQTLLDEHTLYLCQPVRYEVMRGLLKAGATRKQELFETSVTPLLGWLPLVDADWERAAQLWADTRSAGRQLSDIDLLIAAQSLRLNAILVSADADFDATLVSRQNWRSAPRKS